MLDTSNSGLFTDLEQLDLVSCRDSDTVHVFYVKSGQKAPNDIISNVVGIYEPRCEKNGLQGFRPGQTQTGLYSHRSWLDP